MALQLYMIGLVVADMGRALEFYRRLDLAVPEGSEKRSHVQIKMDNGLTLFLDSRPAAWDAPTGQGETPAYTGSAEGYRVILEFYMESRAAVETRYNELVGFGYPSHRAPYVTPYGMYFAMIHDPDGNTILLSAS